MNRRIMKERPKSEDAEGVEYIMMINLDTERLQDMMNLLQDANNSIDSAANKLMSITTHNGWACKERYIINDYAMDNRNLVKALQSDCSSFCAAAKSVADDFVETESGISQMFSSVEGALAQILANPVASVVINASSVGAIASAVFSNGNGGTDGGVRAPNPVWDVMSVARQWAKSLGTGFHPNQLPSVMPIVNLDSFDLNGN